MAEPQQSIRTSRRLTLIALTGGTIMSQAFRTLPTVVAPGLTSDFTLTPEQLSLFAGAFHLSFALAQIPVGVALDVYGTRRVVSVLCIAALAGTMLCAMATNLPMLIAGQLLVGVGCAPAFVGTLYFISKRYPQDAFARMSGLVLSFSGIGLLATGTPLAWIVQEWSWRTGFAVLSIFAAVVLIGILVTARDDPQEKPEQTDSLGKAIAELRSILSMPHTLGIVALALVAYPSYIALRGLWGAPLFMERYGFSLTQAGHVLLASSIATLVWPPLAGFIETNRRTRRYYLVAAILLSAVIFALLALSSHALSDILACVLLGLLTGLAVLQFADAKDAYSADKSGRAFGVLNTAAFLGVATMQWISAFAASFAPAIGSNGMTAALSTISALLILGSVAFLLLPWPQVNNERL